MIRYYRTLTSPDHFSRWEKGQHTSFHHQVPGEWGKIWANFCSEDSARFDARNYPLRLAEGVFTARARDAFLRLSPNHRPADIWPEDELRQISELDGLCVFLCPKEALKYGVESVYGKMGKDQYVEFSGKEICCLPEDKGMLIQLDQILANPMPRFFFVQRHKLA